MLAGSGQDGGRGVDDLDREVAGRDVAAGVRRAAVDGGRAEAERRAGGRQALASSAPETRSVALAVYVTAAPPGPVASAVIVAGSPRTGAVASPTVTVKALAVTFR